MADRTSGSFSIHISPEIQRCRHVCQDSDRPNELTWPNLALSGRLTGANAMGSLTSLGLSHGQVRKFMIAIFLFADVSNAGVL